MLDAYTKNTKKNLESQRAFLRKFVCTFKFLLLKLMNLGNEYSVMSLICRHQNMNAFFFFFFFFHFNQDFMRQTYVSFKRTKFISHVIFHKHQNPLT